MRLIRNSGADRVVDELRRCITARGVLDVATPALSLFAFGELKDLLDDLTRCRLVLPAPRFGSPAFLGSDGDRVYRNRLQTRWLARQCAAWLAAKVEVKSAPGAIPQSTLSIGAAQSGPTRLEEGDIALPDVLTELQDRTQLTRRTIQRVIAGSGRLPDFTRNPQQFIDLAAEAIKRCKKRVVVDGIAYKRLGDQYHYAQELFEQEELTGYLKNMLPAQKAVYEQVVYDSDTEATFAQDLERNTAVNVYAKLPGWFKVPTPLGSYNPDWAVLVETDDGERLYFVVETKAALFADALRGDEGLKIDCGKAHFRALQVNEAPVRYVVERSVDELLAGIGG